MNALSASEYNENQISNTRVDQKILRIFVWEKTFITYKLNTNCPLQSRPLLIICTCPNVPATSGNIAGSLHVRAC
jgi:hypothetical protein